MGKPHISLSLTYSDDSYMKLAGDQSADICDNWCDQFHSGSRYIYREQRSAVSVAEGGVIARRE